MIVFEVILIIIGLITDIAVLEMIGVVLAVAGGVLYLLGPGGHAVGGRRHYG